jgi:phage repressor protein C with HTH and peptisase S24 domain
MSFTHKQMWDGLDALAKKHGLTASGLARRAGLDATAFNFSKRQASDGHNRWPSTGTLSKVLACTGESLKSFAEMMPGTRARRRRK